MLVWPHEILEKCTYLISGMTKRSALGVTELRQQLAPTPPSPFHQQLGTRGSVSYNLYTQHINSGHMEVAAGSVSRGLLNTLNKMLQACHLGRDVTITICWKHYNTCI